MSEIKEITALEILDSRGTPTIYCEVTLSSGIQGFSMVPSGASTGEHEALELRDKDPNRYFGKGVLKAVANINGPINELLKGQSVLDQRSIDEAMISLDGTKSKSKLGANSILGVSLAVARAAANFKKMPLFESISPDKNYLLPTPMMNILNGGAHADNSLDFQEFMIRPFNAPTFAEALRWGSEIFYSLRSLLKEKNHVVSVGDEGGFAPNLSSDEESLDFILKAIEKAGLRPKTDVSIALDCAASEFFDKESKTYIEKKKKLSGHSFLSRTAKEQVEHLQKLCKNYPIDSIEDGLDENDWEGWKSLTQSLGKEIQIVGDDIFVTNPEFLQKGIDSDIGNSILIKLNQIGTLTETLDTMALAKKSNYKCVVSHRSGETEDSFIADLSVATACGQIKTGSLSRSDRIAKYNRLLQIEHLLSDSSKENLFYHK